MQVEVRTAAGEVKGKMTLKLQASPLQQSPAVPQAAAMVDGVQPMMMSAHLLAAAAPPPCPPLPSPPAQVDCLTVRMVASAALVVSMHSSAVAANDPTSAFIHHQLYIYLCVCETSDGWLVAWGLCECVLLRSSAVWLLPVTLL